MKKTLLSILIGAIAVLPLGVSAQTVTPDHHALIEALLSALEQEVSLLQQELQTLTVQQNTLQTQVQEIQSSGNSQSGNSIPDTGGSAPTNDSQNQVTPPATSTPSTPAIIVNTVSVSDVSIQIPGPSCCTINGSYTIVLDVKAGQGDLYIPEDGIDYIMEGNPAFDGILTPSMTSTANQSGNYYLVPAGTDAPFTLNVVAAMPSGESGLYDLSATDINYNTTASQDGMQTEQANARTNPMLIATH